MSEEKQGPTAVDLARCDPVPGRRSVDGSSEETAKIEVYRFYSTLELLRVVHDRLKYLTSHVAIDTGVGKALNESSNRCFKMSRCGSPFQYGPAAHSGPCTLI